MHVDRVRAPTKAEEALTTIRSRIESGELPGGERLTLHALSDELQMSLTPIREALRVLQSSGLVEYRRHQGHVVTRYSLKRAREVYLLRKQLEPLATLLAAENATDDELMAIRDLDGRFDDAAARRATDVVEMNSRWHHAVYASSHSPILKELIERLWNGVPYQAIWFVNRSQNSADDHRFVTDALLVRDGEAAAAAMLQHIERGEAATLDHLQLIGAPTGE